MLTLTDIQAARERIRHAIYLTPCAHSVTLSHLLGCELYLKLENLQVTGSFKERGALNCILQLSPEQRAVGVIAASAGNHAQGVAHVASLYNIPATIVMPETTPLAKIQGTRSLGATVVLHGSSYDEAYEHAVTIQQQQGSTLIHAFNNPAIIAGQGSIGLELLEQIPDMDHVVVPVGGGGLIAGIATAIKQTRPEVIITGVETERMPAMQASLNSSGPVRLPFSNTIADGISVARVGDLTLPLVRQYVSAMVCVNEEQIAQAILALLEQEKTLAEGAGAVGFAAVLDKKIPGITGKKIVVIISGGNIDMTMLARILERGLESDGRLTHISVIMHDKPGNIAELSSVIAEHDANILNISQNRSVSEVSLGETVVELLLESRGWRHVNAICESIRQRGYPVKKHHSKQHGFS